LKERKEIVEIYEFVFQGSVGKYIDENFLENFFSQFYFRYLKVVSAFNQSFSEEVKEEQFISMKS
jgi:hypothetical protein